MAKVSDTIILIENDKLSSVYKDLTLFNAFKKADAILVQAARAISDIMSKTGFINVDFSDVKRIMQNKGFALIGSGTSKGNDRAIEAANSAVNNPLLSHISLDNCKGLLVNVTAGMDLKMDEYKSIIEVITNKTGKKPIIIDGLVIEENMKNEVHVTLIATGLDSKLAPSENDMEAADEENEQYTQPELDFVNFEDMGFKKRGATFHRWIGAARDQRYSGYRNRF